VKSFPILVAVLATLPLLPAQRDTRAGVVQALGATATPGAQPPIVVPQAAPILGGAMILQVQAPGYDAAALLIGDSIRPSILRIGATELAIHLPLERAWSVPIVLQRGIGKLQIPVPTIRSLIGIDVPMQVVAVSSRGVFGASNLLIANPGLSDAAGTLHYTLIQDPVHGGKLPAGGWFGFDSALGFKYWTVYESPYVVLEARVCLTGTATGPIVIDDDTNAANGNLGTITPDAKGNYSHCVWVKPGTKVYVFNPGAAATEFTMSGEETDWR
jgi:hypothetical protein